MKRNSTTFFLLIIITAGGFGCKKDNHGGTTILPEKKWIVSTIAGDGTDGVANGPAMSAKFQSPADVAVTAGGSIYVADYLNHRIRKISGGQVTTWAGSGISGLVNGEGDSAQLADPYRIASDANGNIYVLDEIDPRIRKISATAYVSTFAGKEQPGFLDGASLLARFEVDQEGVVADAQGNIYIGDTFNERIRKISTAAQVSTFSGNGTEGLTDGIAGVAQFKFPNGITIDKQGNVYVADAGNFCIRKITPAGTVSTLTGGTRGTADGMGNAAQFGILDDIVADSTGNLYVTDEQRIRKITPQGAVSTIADSTAGYVDGGG